MTRREKIERLLLGEPRDAFLNFSLAMEFVKEGDREAALTQFDRVLSMDGTYLTAYFQKANTLAALGRIDEARACFRSGIAAAHSVGDSHAAGEMQGALDALV